MAGLNSSLSMIELNDSDEFKHKLSTVRLSSDNGGDVGGMVEDQLMPCFLNHANSNILALLGKATDSLSLHPILIPKHKRDWKFII